MRISRLHLLRYGRFTDQALDFPRAESDIHIVFGRNEAGKSTALAALEDLLFGIPGQTPLAFVHDYPALRIGAVLERDGERVLVRRRKGNRDTLLDADDHPLPAGEGALAPFLAGADRGFFQRMFSLDHQRLRQGGQAILEARDDMGQMLFSAGAGVAGLRGILQSLDEEADGLWAPRRAARRSYYQAADRHEEARRALREHTVTLDGWQQSKRAFEAAGREYVERDEEERRKNADLRRLNRVRRVYQDVARRAELRKELDEHEATVLLPADAADTLDNAQRREAAAQASLSTLSEQLEALRRDRDALRFDAEFVAREEDIARLSERRTEALASRRDLPLRQAELAAEQEALRRLAAEVDWPAADLARLIERIPSQSKVDRVRDRLTRRGQKHDAVDAARATLEATRAEAADSRRQLEEIGPLADASPLQAATNATRARGDLEGEIRAAAKEEGDAEIEIRQLLDSLKPAVAGEDALVPCPPPRATVEAHRDHRRDLDQRRRTCQRAIRDAEQECASLQALRQRLERDEHAVSPEQLAAARQRRDREWSKLRSRYIDSPVEERPPAPVDAEDDPTVDFAQALREADQLADRRFEHAETAARLASAGEEADELEESLQQLRAQDDALAQEDQALAAEWQALWEDIPVEPGTDDEMLVWMTVRDALLAQQAIRQRAQGQLRRLRREEGDRVGQLATALQAFIGDADALRGQPLRTVLERAGDVLAEHQRRADRAETLEKAWRKAEREVEARQRQLSRAQDDWATWQKDWRDALTAASLDAATPADEAAERLRCIDDMRSVAKSIRDLQRDRIDTMEKDIEQFEAEAAVVVREIAANLDSARPEEAVRQLVVRLEAEKKKREARRGKDRDSVDLERKIRELEESRAQDGQAIRALCERAGVETVDDLRAAVAHSDRLRKSRADFEAVTQRLHAAGDGRSLDELHDECAAADPDRLEAEEQAVERELAGLRERRQEAYERRAQAGREFEQIGGHDAAARAMADQQAALSEQRRIAERYARLRSAALLLEWGIDRYRKTRQAPLLQRAGTLFSTLTRGSFAALTLQYDDQDRPSVAGCRPDGAVVGVDGLSTGTADQLYLALRIAAIEDYLDRTSPLPFVADDLFVHFDDERAAAGLQVLGELARRCQVIFFTHHERLLEVATRTLSKDVSVATLA